MLSEEVITEISNTAMELYDRIKPWYYDQQYLLTYNSPETIKLLLKHYDIELHKKPIQVDSFCGLLCIDELGTTILVNENHIPSRQLFTITHELGHYFLHREFQSQFIEQGLNEDVYSHLDLVMERQANLFASELIVPLEVLEMMLQKRYSFFRMAKIIGVSKEALKWRIHRYLQDRYKIPYKFALMLLEEFKDKSLKQRAFESLIFDMNVDRYVLFEVFEALSGRESFISNYRNPTKIGVVF